MDIINEYHSTTRYSSEYWAERRGKIKGRIQQFNKHYGTNGFGGCDKYIEVLLAREASPGDRIIFVDDTSLILKSSMFIVSREFRQKESDEISLMCCDWPSKDAIPIYGEIPYVLPVAAKLIMHGWFTGSMDIVYDSSRRPDHWVTPDEE